MGSKAAVSEMGVRMILEARDMERGSCRLIDAEMKGKRELS